MRYEDIKVHTNSIEGFWNILKKQINGIHHSVSAKHLQRYYDESAFRYNHRKALQDERFAYALAKCEGTLQWKRLTNKKDKMKRNPYLKEVGARIQAFRKAKNITIRGLGELCKLDYSTLSRIEGGQ